MHGGRLLARALAAQGVQNVFGLCGDHVSAIFDGCADEGIRIIDARQEAAAAHMAEGWSLATGEPGVAVVTGGPGLTNSLTAVADAFLAGTPMVVVTSRVRLSESGKGYPQDMDQLGVVRPITVAARTVSEADRIPVELAEAFSQARSRRGPAVLEVPLDVQLGRVADAAIEETPLPPPPPAGRIAVEAAVKLLADAERPVAVVGEGAFWSGAGPALERFAEAWRVPVFTLRAGRGLIPDDHELCFGPPNFLRGTGQAAFGRADLLLVVGCELDIVLAFGNLAPQALLIRADADPARAIRHRHPTVALVGDEGRTLIHLADAGSGSDREGWIDELRGAAAGREETPEGGPVHPVRLVSEVAEAAGKPATFAVDAGELALWAMEGLPATGPGRMLSSFTTPLATLGPGIPFAIAAKLARPDEPSIALVGDGAFGFSAMEIDTAARHRIPITVVVGNDNAWGIVKRQTEIGFGRSVATDLAPRDYGALGEALGGTGERVENAAALGDALKRALASPVPAVVDVVLDRTVEHPAIKLIAPMFAPDQ